MMPSSAAIEEAAKKYAIKNAMDYGKANEGAVLSKVIAELRVGKDDIKSLSLKVKEIVAEVNLLTKEELAREYKKYEEEFGEAAKEKAAMSARHNFSIEGATEANFITRFPPEPGGYMHLGHAKPLFIEDELRRLYKGKLFLYFDDTNPDNERQEFVDSFRKDIGWLGVTFDREYYASDSIPVLYEYAKQAIEIKAAYVCTCSAEAISAGRTEGKACEHKASSTNRNAELWEKMLKGEFVDNEAVLRLNGDMSAANTTLRDPTLFRIKKTRHYRQGRKYAVWPTYDFCTPILDSINGITDVIRSKEYEMRDELYFAVLERLKLSMPRITSIARLEISNNLTSKRKIRQLIAERKVVGWDDPRLVTISGLRRRGIRPEAIREFALSFGMGKSESSVGLEKLLAYNRKIVEPGATRLLTSEVAAEGYIRCNLAIIGNLMDGDAFNEDSLIVRQIYAEKSVERLVEGGIARFKGVGLFKLEDADKRYFLSL